MLKRIFSFFLSLEMILLLATYSQVTARRISITVMNTKNEPLEKTKVIITSPERNDFKKEFFTDKKGKFAFLLPMEIKSLSFHLEKEGYQTLEETIELRRMRSSQSSFLYEGTFVLFQNDELTPEQRAQLKVTNEKALEHFNAGIALFEGEKFIEAAKEFEEASKIKPDFYEAYENMAASYFRAEEYEKAIEAANKALEIEPESYKTLKIISISYSALGNEEKAMEYLEKMKHLPDAEFSPEELYNLAVTAANRNDDEEAKQYFEKAIELKPDFALAHYQLGMCYFRLNELENAQKELERYLELEPEGEHAEVAKAILESIKKN